jgi:hypothetical protein
MKKLAIISLAMVTMVFLYGCSKSDSQAKPANISKDSSKSDSSPKPTNISEGIFGLRWGATQSSLDKGGTEFYGAEMKIVDRQDGSRVVYHDGKRIVGQFPNEMVFCFHKNRFYQAAVFGKEDRSDCQNYYKLQKMLEEKYGKSKYDICDEGHRDVWDVKQKVNIMLLFNEPEMRISLYYVYEPIFEELQRDRENYENKAKSRL